MGVEPEGFCLAAVWEQLVRVVFMKLTLLMLILVKGFVRRGSLVRSRALSASSSGESSRFWSRQLDLRERQVSESESGAKLNISAKLEQLKAVLQEDHPDSSGVTNGVVLYPLTGLLDGESKSLLVPIHDGMLQTQHAKVVNHNHRSTAFLCAFSPRAQHVVIAPSEEDRPVDDARFKSLEAALATHANITSAELLSEELAGTPPARIYRSFVAPRPGRTHILEPVERAALRTAQQIDLAMRQVRADRAVYLRNTDKPQPLPSDDADEFNGIDAARKLCDAKGEGEGKGEREGEGACQPQHYYAAPMYPHRPVVHPLVLVLDNVRSAFNVGSLFRTAETAGLAEVITVGITAHPPHPKLRKTAMSAIDVVPSRHFTDIMGAVAQLRSEGYQIVAMETTSRSQRYTQAAYGAKVALVLGNEVTGVDTRVMEGADLIVEIPTFGIKNSLNVASAGPIVVFELLRQWSAC